MINFNGALISEQDSVISINNRGLKYGDSLFETLRVKEGEILFSEDHYFRLMASMRMIRMEIPMSFTLDFFEAEIKKLLVAFPEKLITKVRFSVARKEGGLYLPVTNEIDFWIEAFEGVPVVKDVYKVDLFKDYYVTSGLLSTIKSSNRLLNVLSSIYASENELDNCVLINEHKNIVEVSNGNVFLVKGTVVKTPKLLDGCIKGIARKKIIELIEKDENLTLEEVSISPFELQKADEVFITNAVVGVQPVTNYRKKKFSTTIGEALSIKFKNLV